ncbi:MAG: hypothetical protein WBQ68_12135 [Terriglobales bacterium]
MSLNQKLEERVLSFVVGIAVATLGLYLILIQLLGLSIVRRDDYLLRSEVSENYVRKDHTSSGSICAEDEKQKQANDKTPNTGFESLHTDPSATKKFGSTPLAKGRSPALSAVPLEDSRQNDIAPPVVTKKAIQQKPGLFETEAYTITTESLQKVADTANLVITVEPVGDQPPGFYVFDCYLLDESGERWNMQGADSAGFANTRTPLIPGTKVRSEFHFVAKGSTSGTRFTFICSENITRPIRQIVVPGISAR